ncbi:MAG TPA: hypothetical protein VFP55_09540 [Solirubrobacteraceae bacterium]|nr:hypothetical protein [Solirubrobacteraceae bacterium]
MLTKPLTNFIDLALAAWVCAWIAIGVAIGVQVGNLSSLSKTVVKEGLAVHTVGTTLRSLGGIPVIGGPIASDARAVQAAGASAVTSGTSTESTISTLSVLLGIAVALLPTVPVLLIYLPARLGRRQETIAVREALRAHGGSSELREFLAQQALHTLGYRRLSRLGVRIGAALTDEETTVLAEAELRRLQIEPGALRVHASDRV